MITITPQGSVCLCKTPLEKDYKHQLTFATATAQSNYFNGSSVKFKTYSDYTYIKKDGTEKTVTYTVDESSRDSFIGVLSLSNRTLPSQ